MSNTPLVRLLILAVVLPLSTAAPPAHALDWHPLFGQDIIGNRAEAVTLWNDGTGDLPLCLDDFDNDTMADMDTLALSPGGPGGITAGLVAYWNLDTDFTATWGGSAYDGDPSGPLATGDVVIDPTGGRFGGAAYFTRAESTYVTISAPVVTRGQDHTYSAWFRTTFYPTPEGPRWFVLETTAASGDAYAASFGLLNIDGDGHDALGEVYTQWDIGTKNMRAVIPTPANQWNNIVVTYDASAARHDMWLDGVWKTSMTSADSLKDTDGLIIGGHRSGTGRNWDGWIDEVAFWDRVLTGEEIAALQLRPVRGASSRFQQLDLVSADFDGDEQDEVIAAYTQETDCPTNVVVQDIRLVLPDVQAGVLAWNSAGTRDTLFMPLGYPYPEADWNYVNGYAAVAPGNVRLATGNLDGDEAPELALIKAAGVSVSPLEWHLFIGDVQGGLPVWWSGPRASGSVGDVAMRESQRFDLAAGDLDGDGIDELVVASNYRDSATSYSHYVQIWRYDEATGNHTLIGESRSSSANWSGDDTWNPVESFHAETNRYDRDRVVCGIGKWRSGADVTPFIALAVERRHWNTNRTITSDGLVWLFQVDTTTSPWTIIPPNGGAGYVNLPDTASPVQPDWRVTGRSLGLAVGDLNFDASDEVVLAAPDSLRIYGVTKPGTLGLQQKAVYPKVGRYNDPSRRIVDIQDLDADPNRSSPSNWQPEIVLQDWTGTAAPAHLRTQVLRPQLQSQPANGDTSYTITGILPPVCVLHHDSVIEPGGQTAVHSADVDGDAFRIGAYTYHSNVASRIPTVILNAPPVLLDINPETASPDTIDLSGCYEPDAPPCDFRATYRSDTTSTISSSTEFTPGWGPSDGWAAKSWLSNLWKKVSDTFTRAYGDDFSSTSLASQTVQVGSAITASMDQDQIHSIQTVWDVYEYQMHALGDSVAQILVVVPQSAQPGWDTPVSWMNDFGCSQDELYRLDHEAGNMLSYPRDLGVAAIDQLKAGYATISYGTGAPYHFWFDSVDFNSMTTDTSRSSGLVVGSLVDWLGSNLGLWGQYSSDSLLTITTSLQTHLAVDVYFGSLDRTNWEYKVWPRMFWRHGILNVDYEIDFNGYKWDSLYAVQPDPGFVLPHRYDAVKDTTYDGANLYHSPDVTVQAPSILLNKPYAQVGQMVTISADVRNFSKLKCAVGPEVEFYLWKEGWSSAIVLGTAVADTIPSRGRAPTVSVDWVVPSWVDPEVRLYARIDPPRPGYPAGFIEEIHENNNIGYTILKTDGNGSGPPTGAPTVAWLPESFALRQNAPNPFGSSTVIELALPVNARATLRVYDVTGRLVKTVADEAFPAGIHPVRWDGRDSDGQRVASGVYFYRMESGDFRATRKLLVLR